MRLGLEAGGHTLDLAVELGIGGVPITAEALARDGVAATLAPLRDRGLSVCQIGAFGFNPLSPDAKAREQQQQTLSAALPLAAETGCRYVVIGSGNYHPSAFGGTDARNFRPEAITALARELAPIVRLAEACGALICIELYLKAVISSPARFLALSEQVGSPALRANIDVTSLYDFGAMIDPAATVEAVCSQLAGHYGLGHIKDIGLDEGFHLHMGLAPLGTSPTDWSDVLRRMSLHLAEDSWLILEHIQTPEEGRASAQLLRAAAQAAGVTLD
jgi:sugar phosphate isomerase/epimerase